MQSDDSIPVNPVSPVVPWVGGKRNLARAICARIEAIPHRCYAEPFVGAGGVFFRRRRRPPSEAINDRSGDVSTLFRVLQRHPQALSDELRWGLSSRTEFSRLRAADPAGLTDIERAARLVFLQVCGFGGKVGSPTWGFSRTERAAFAPARLRRAIGRAHDRLVGVHIDGRDFAEFLARWDAPATLFYLDPPYWGAEHYYGRGLWQRGDFERLATCLDRLSGSFLLSLNDTREVRSLFHRYRVEEVPVTYHIHGGGPRPAVELLISSA